MEFEIVKLSKILATTGYRTLSNVEKAAKLVADNHCGMGLAAIVCQTTKTSLFRAVHAMLQGRNVGQTGKPHC